MYSAIQKLSTVRHPLISSVHMRKDFGARHKAEDVLVIETKFPNNDDEIHSFDSYLMDLLADLKNLQRQAQREVGKIDRVDIKVH